MGAENPQASDTRARSSEPPMDEHEPPKGALVFILIFLLLLVGFWLNTYMRLWLRY